MVCVVNFVLPLSQLQGVEWGWPGRREPDDERTPRLRRGGGIASFSNLVLLVLVLLYIIVYFVCDSASELERWARKYSLFGGFLPAPVFCFSVFLNCFF